MMLTHLCLAVPRDLTIWQWLFDSPHSALQRFPAKDLAGYQDCVTGARVSYADVKEHTTHLSTALVKHHGLRPNDCIALFSPNTIYYPVAMLAALRVGAVISGASPAYNVEEMTYALKKGNAKFLMTVPGSMGVAAAAAKEAGIPKERVFILEGKMKGHMNVLDLIEQGKNEESVPQYKMKNGQTNKSLCGFLSFSSGTTGLPKAVSLPFLYHRGPAPCTSTRASLLIGSPGHDLAPKCNRPMSPSRPDHAV
jgi:4-coumarate--CoA ligase